MTETKSSQGEPGLAVDLPDLFASMALIRAFEQQVAELYAASEIPGFVHTSLGQEAVAAGVGSGLADDDYIATTHRGHGHCLARGMDVDGMMAELFARADGLCAGKGGSMHIADPTKGVLGANAIVGASVPLAVGAGLSSKLLGQNRVAAAFFGEGATNQGAFLEALNLAAIWDAPVLFVCENNIYAEFTDSRTMNRVHGVVERCAAFGVPGEIVDGNDVEAVFEITRKGAQLCREGKGPFLIEATTYRWHGHYEGDPQAYKPEGEEKSWRERDPLIVARGKLLERKQSDDADLDAVEAAAVKRVDAAVERARLLPAPSAEEAYADVYGD